MDIRKLQKAIAPLLEQRAAIEALSALLAADAELAGMESRNTKRRGELSEIEGSLAAAHKRVETEQYKLEESHRAAIDAATEALVAAKRDGDANVNRVKDKYSADLTALAARHTAQCEELTTRTNLLKADKTALESSVDNLRREVARLIGMTKAA